MRRQIERTLLTLLGIGVAVIPIRSQTKPQKPSFEVASINPTPPSGIREPLGLLGGPRGDRLTYAGATLRTLINISHRDPATGALLEMEIFGAPDWMDSVFYDVEAKADCSGGIIPSNQLALMVQSMLEDRFHLKVHVETRDMPVYNLVVGKDGPKLKVSADQTPLPPAITGSAFQLCGSASEAPTARASLPYPAPGADMSQYMSQLPRGSMAVLMQQLGVMTLTARATPISLLASRLRLWTGRQVIDKTGLTGLFDMALKFSTDGMAPPPGTAAGVAAGLRGGPSSSTSSGQLAGPAVNGTPVAAEPAPILFSAIQDLGLRLEQARGPVPVIVIDIAQKPSEN